MISAFGYLHERNIVHRDIKADNMLIDDRANLLVCDFGLAYKFKNSTETTKTGCGTPTTIAPELLRNEEYRLMPDWWSVGIVIYEMMCKRKPFEVPALPSDDAGRKELRRRTLEDTI